MHAPLKQTPFAPQSMDAQGSAWSHLGPVSPFVQSQLGGATPALQTCTGVHALPHGSTSHAAPVYPYLRLHVQVPSDLHVP